MVPEQCLDTSPDQGSNVVDLAIENRRTSEQLKLIVSKLLDGELFGIFRLPTHNYGRLAAVLPFIL